MEQIKYKTKRVALQFAAVLAISIFLVSCTKKKDGTLGLEELTLLAMTMGGNQAEFRLSNMGALAAARSASFQQSSMLPHSAGLLTDLAGEDPQNYGDGNADGFNDHFITPAAAGIEVCQMVAYKSVAKGGPAPGTETLENADWKLMSFPQFDNAEDLAFTACPAWTPIPITGDKSGFLKLNNPIHDQIQDYDRVGIVARSFVYYLDPNQAPEHSYRYTTLILDSGLGEEEADSVVGTVQTKIFSSTDGCPESWLTSPGYVLWDQNELINLTGPCSSLSAWVDATTGTHMENNYSVGYLNPPVPGTTTVHAIEKRLKFKQPATSGGALQPSVYVLVLPFNTSKENGSELLFEVSVDNVLFWDSNDGNNVFSPQLDAADRPNATNGENNLTDPTKKNIIFHLPTILGSLK
ncbi:hypothetical protein AB3N59_15225 [Leptospira sp. WS92.C1]